MIKTLRDYLLNGGVKGKLFNYDKERCYEIEKFWGNGIGQTEITIVLRYKDHPSLAIRKDPDNLANRLTDKEFKRKKKSLDTSL